MEEKKTRKYLAYAFSEVLLVVIGILIALGINNWNEDRKLINKKIEILNEISTSLANDLEKLRTNMVVTGRVKSSAHLLLDYMEQDLPYHDTLALHFANTMNLWGFFLSTGIYDSYRSSDVHLITSGELKEKLSYVYELRNTHLLKGYDHYRQVLESASEAVIPSRFDEFWGGNYEDWKLRNDFNKYNTEEMLGSMTPLDFETLKKDHEYLYFLKSIINKYNWLIEMQCLSLEESIVDLQTAIDVELAMHQ